MIGVDGGNLRKLANNPGGVVYPLISPDAQTLVFSGASSGVYSLPLKPSPGAPAELPGTRTDGQSFQAMCWSPDGKRLAGTGVFASGRSGGVAVYDLVAHTLATISTDETSGVRWFADSRRMMYFTKNGTELVVLDAVSHARTVVDVRLPAPATHDFFAVAPDNRTIYYGAARSEADIWIMPYLEFDVPAGTAKGIEKFYK